MPEPVTPSPRPRVVVLGLGGTIAMTQTAGGGVTPTLSARDLVDAVPGLADTGIEVNTLSLLNRPGASLTGEDILQLAETLTQHFADGVAGAVITQGTDTIEETAYLLDLLHTGAQPIVVTGAMRNPTLAGADGPANLLAAVTVAASPRARELGCVVVLADEIHAAARVRKRHSMSTAAFVSPTGGTLGYVVEGQARILNRPSDRAKLSHQLIERPLPRVGIHTAALGDDGALLPILARELDGLVIAGFGVGHVPDIWVTHLEAAAHRIPVVLASRTGAGFTASTTYGFPGSERDLLDRGLIPAGILDAYKARLLLQLTLASTSSHAEALAAFTALSQADGTPPLNGAATPFPEKMTR
ncbi:asparaginase [Actinoplanes sp. NPDC020271]|uniref:asparaginase n=1 Tax=Actinoplanes sp. NPDC020271 TaxID=3363896 RepID=UPI00379C44D3